MDTATAGVDFARALFLDLGTDKTTIPLPFGFAFAFAFILGIAGFAIAAVCDDSKSTSNNGALVFGTGAAGRGRWLEEAGSAAKVLGTGHRKGASCKLRRVLGKILRSCSSDGSMLGNGKTNASGKCFLMYLLIPDWPLEKPSSLKAPIQGRSFMNSTIVSRI